MKSTAAKAVLPSRLIWPAPAGEYGLRTPATDGDLATSCSRAVMRLRTAGALIEPLDTCQTIESESPDWLGSAVLSSAERLVPTPCRAA